MLFTQTVWKAAVTVLLFDVTSAVIFSHDSRLQLRDSLRRRNAADLGAIVDDVTGDVLGGEGSALGDLIARRDAAAAAAAAATTLDVRNTTVKRSEIDNDTVKRADVSNATAKRDEDESVPNQARHATLWKGNGMEPPFKRTPSSEQDSEMGAAKVARAVATGAAE